MPLGIRKATVAQMDFWKFISEQGFTIFILCVGLFAVWNTWRADTKEAAAQRERNIEALETLGKRIESISDKTADLSKSLSDFFLKNFP